jgi:two-component system chemotaxis response regulator CheB
MSEGTIRVVIVDDSLVPREMIKQILSSDPEIDVVGVARNGAEGVEMVAKLRPDLVTMDIHMPVMDGLEATERIMAETPTPILVVSTSVHGEGMGRAFDALEAGALDVMKKPEPRDWEDMQRVGRDLIGRARILSRVRVITHIRGRRRLEGQIPEAPVPVAPPAKIDIVAVGSSTGGPSALLHLLGGLPEGLDAPLVIAQHIADGFMPGLVGWLNAGCRIDVRLAEEGMLLEPGAAYFAQTGCNLEIHGMRAAFTDLEPGQLYVPSADTLFRSVLREHGRRALGIILTGMGSDGALGLKALHDAGAPTIAESEATCTVFGMPRAAIELGATDSVLPVHEIPTELLRQLGAGASTEAG